MKRGQLIAVSAVLVFVVAVAAAVITLVKFSSSDESHDPATDAHVHLDERGSDPDAVAEAALAAMFSWQPAIDPSPAAAVGRAQRWLGGQLAADATQPTATGIRPLPQWAGWRDSGDIVTATAQSGEPISASDTRQVLDVALTQTVLHRDGSTTPYSDYRVRAVVEKNTDTWQLTEYNLAPK
ncbi:MAG: hypothetical protein U5N21_15045 [Rhodococcus sp. (in: high G+C Gram-positive bacteria)]|nr:hypothetical protein [Rhodococcus sp. (in: high G+C Gram-positive bacteria)]